MRNLKLLALCAAAAPLLMAAPAAAQEGYMFGMPRASVSVHLGLARPVAEGEIFNFMTDQLTLDRDDFASATFGVDFGMRVHPQVDVLLGLGVAQSSQDSEFRDFVEDNDAAIRQTTELMRLPVTAGLKLHLLPRGRSLGRYAFIPARFSPYVGGGAGVMWYRLEQEGDFVDFETLDIFTDHFQSDGATLTAHAFGGGDVWLTSKLAFNAEARYSWAEADLNDSFSDFERIDLSGWQVTAGITLRY